jgi:hypothetical protein
VRPYLKNNFKKAGSMAQVVDHLPSKLEAQDTFRRMKWNHPANKKVP